jgi:hypothetical protein
MFTARATAVTQTAQIFFGEHFTRRTCFRAEGKDETGRCGDMYGAKTRVGVIHAGSKGNGRVDDHETSLTKVENGVLLSNVTTISSHV